jgi:hypothetical protein
MRIVIATIIIISMINNIDAVRGVNAKKYFRNLNKAIYNVCNKEAYRVTNNTEIYNCINVNNTIKCQNLENFTEYNNLRMLCVKRNNSEFSYGIVISIIIWVVLALSAR